MDEVTLVSKSLSYKALIKKNDSGKFLVEIYAWPEGLESQEDILWERIGSPISVHDFEEAQKIAQENLDLFSLEIRDEEPDPVLVRILKSKDLDFDFYLGKNFEIDFFSDAGLEEKEPSLLSAQKGSEKLIPQNLVRVEEFYLGLVDDFWYVGILESRGTIQSWIRFEDFSQALDSIGDLP